MQTKGIKDLKSYVANLVISTTGIVGLYPTDTKESKQKTLSTNELWKGIEIFFIDKKIISVKAFVKVSKIVNLQITHSLLFEALQENLKSNFKLTLKDLHLNIEGIE